MAINSISVDVHRCIFRVTEEIIPIPHALSSLKLIERSGIEIRVVPTFKKDSELYRAVIEALSGDNSEGIEIRIGAVDKVGDLHISARNLGCPVSDFMGTKCVDWPTVMDKIRDIGIDVLDPHWDEVALFCEGSTRTPEEVLKGMMIEFFSAQTLFYEMEARGLEYKDEAWVSQA